MNVLSQTARTHWEFGSLSDVGRVRRRNEDALHVDPDGRYAVLADGMGGYRGGDVAAGLAVAVVKNVLDAGLAAPFDPDMVARMLFDAIRDANAAIYDAGQADPALAGMGCTLILATFVGDEVVSAHVGDSRLYRWRDVRLALLTRDHTMLQEQVDGGIISAEEARGYAYRGLLTRGLGVADEVLPDLGIHDAVEGDVFLLCSDGLTDMLDDRSIAASLASPAAVGEVAATLVRQANDRGGRDNVSVVVGRLVV